MTPLPPHIPDRIEAPVIIQEVITPDTWRASLPNGKLIFAYCSWKTPQREFDIGDAVTARLSVQDFSRGEVVG